MQPVHYFLILLFAVFPAALFVQHLRQKKKIRSDIRAQFGKARPPLHPDKLRQAGGYWETCAAQLPEYAAVDRITWNDLEMDLLFHAVNTTFSSVGEQVLYARLHRLEGPDLEPLITLFLEEEDLRNRITYLLHDLSKDYESDVHAFLFAPDRHRMAGYAVWQTWLPLAGMALSLYSPPAGIVLTSLSLLWNFRTRKKNHVQAQYGVDALRYVASAVRTAKSIRPLLAGRSEEYSLKLGSAIEPLASLPSRLPLKISPGDLFSLFVEYLHYTLLLDFFQYNRALHQLIADPEALLRFWETLGDIDIALSVASLEQRLPMVRPVFHDEYSIRAEAIYHPLITDPVTNPADFSQSLLISGSNASGKSTYVKAIAISAIVSQNLGRAFAGSFAMKPGNVMTSMAIRDNLYEGDSYFVAEIKSLRRMIDASLTGQTTYLFIDEILKGTNTIERIASSHALLNWFHEKRVLVMGATHDIELTELQAESMRNLHFREMVTRDEVLFDYKVKPGPTRTTNAINLLGYYGFPEELTEAARKMAETFLQTRVWRKEDTVDN